MKYVSFVIGIVLVVLIGLFVWNVISDVFIGVNVDMFDGQQSQEENNDEVVFEPQDDNSSDSQIDNQDDTQEEEEITTPVSNRKGVVSISGVRRSDSYDNDPQEVRLRANLDEGEVVNITGWTIQTNEETVRVPSAVNFYDVTSSNSESPIILDEGDDVTIYFDESPISDSLRLNQCTGYLNEKHDLDIFPERCPQVEKSEYRHLSGDCQDYINDINGDCRTPTAEELNSFPGSDEGNACRRFVSDHFNAGYCMDINEDNPDFLSDEWMVWIDKSGVLDPDHDWVRLYNKNGILIDERDY